MSRVSVIGPRAGWKAGPDAWPLRPYGHTPFAPFTRPRRRRIVCSSWTAGRERRVCDGNRIHGASAAHGARRSEEHTSELQSLMRISYAVFCLKKKTKTKQSQKNTNKYDSCLDCI